MSEAPWATSGKQLYYTREHCSEQQKRLYSAAISIPALQLMVYYRNSSLAKGALTKIEAEAELKVEEKSAGTVTLEGLDDDF